MDGVNMIDNPCKKCEHYCEYDPEAGNGKGLLHVDPDELITDKTILCFIPAEYWCRGMMCFCKAHKKGYSWLIYFGKNFYHCFLGPCFKTNLEIPFWTVK